MKEQVLHLLHDANDYISGEDISNRLGVSRNSYMESHEPVEGTRL